MILRSIRIQGWRCFADPIRVGPFSEGLNVLHAPNATGKSTLLEALLRGLLDGHRVGGREVEAIRPWGRSLAPTVTVEFTHGGTDYRLTKRFLDRASVELERQESGRFVRMAEGEAADVKVREILTRHPPGRGLSRPENWGLAQVLWAPQGNLALSPLSGDVVADIRSSLGAQVSGPASGPVEQRIEEMYFRFFTPGGRLKGGKDAPALVALREALRQACDRQRIAAERQRAFGDAARSVEDLRSRRAQARRDAEALTKALHDARHQAENYRRLLAEAAQRKERAKAAEAQHSELKQRIEAIKTTEKGLKDAREALHQLQGNLPLSAREVAEREKEATRAEQALEEARGGRSAVDEAAEQATLARRYLEGRRRTTELTERLHRIAEASERLAARKQGRSNLVAPDEATLRAIRKAVKDRDDAQVRLDAALITLEILPHRDGSAVIVAGEETGTRLLSPGTPTVVKGAPEVVVDLPGIARLRARGPSGSVAELREERDQAVRRLKALTAGFGTSDLDTLESLSEQARRLEEKIAEADTQCSTLLSGESVEHLQREWAKLSAALDEIIETHPAWANLPPDTETLEATAGKIKHAFIVAVEGAEVAWKAAQTALTAAMEQKASLGVRLEETDRQARALESKLADLTGDGKKDAERQDELKRIALAWEAARASLEEIEKSLAAFGEDPTQAVDKLEKQLRGAEEAATTALEAEKREEGRLEYLAAQGPYSALASTEEDVARLEQEASAEELRVAAVRLLYDIITQCRAEALAAVAMPVEAAATRMLQRIAGERLGPVQFGEGFEPAHVLPGAAGASVSIDNVSGGEREQIYLATRLALAEVLTRDERQLVILDDVLTATDTGRLARIMTILEEAAQHLQILVLTCHPERYRGLDGARFVDLEALMRDGAIA